MNNRVLVLDREKENLQRAIETIDSTKFDFIFYRKDDVLNESGEGISFSFLPKTISHIDGIMSKTPFNYVLASSESDIQFAGFLRSRYGLVGLDATRSGIVSNKLQMRRFFTDIVPSPQYWRSGQFLELAKGQQMLPEKVVIKPLYGSSSKGVICLSLSDAIDYIRSSNKLYIIESFVDMSHELHCDGTIINGELDIFILSKYARPWIKKSCCSNATIHLPATYPMYDEARRFINEIIYSLNLDKGVFHLELFENEGSLIFGEIGLRPGGGGITESIKYFFGVDLWEAYTKSELGIEEKLNIIPSSSLYTGYIGYAEEDNHNNPLTLERSLFPHVIKLNKARCSSKSGCLAYRELLFFKFDSENQVMEQFEKITNKIKNVNE